VNYRADGLAMDMRMMLPAVFKLKTRMEVVVPAHGDRSGIHHSEPLRQHFEVGDFPILYGIREFERSLSKTPSTRVALAITSA